MTKYVNSLYSIVMSVGAMKRILRGHSIEREREIVWDMLTNNFDRFSEEYDTADELDKYEKEITEVRKVSAMGGACVEVRFTVVEELTYNADDDLETVENHFSVYDETRIATITDKLNSILFD